MSTNGLLPGILATLGLIAAIEILSSTAFSIPNAGVACLLAVTYAAYTGGIPSGLVSAAATVIYVAWNWSPAGEPFHLTEFDARRLAVLSIVAPGMVYMVGALRRRSERQHETALANVTLRAKIAGRKRFEERCRALMEYAGDALLVADLNGNLLDINKRGEHVLGYTKAEIRGMNVTQIHPPEELERVSAVFDLISRGQTAFYNDGFVLTKDGTKVPVDITANAIEYGGKKVALGIFREISARKQSEEALRESETRFRQLAENIREMFWIRDVANRRTLYLSPAYEDITGRKLGDLDEAYRSFLDCIHPADREQIHAEVDKRPLQRSMTVLEFRIVRPNGAIRWIRSRAFPLLNGSGNVYRIVGVAEDITDAREQHEARLAYAVKQRETLVQEVHHRIKNSLQAVAGLLMREAFQRPELGPLLQRAIGQVQLVAMVHGIRAGASVGGIVLCEITPEIARMVENFTHSRIRINVNVNMPRRAQIRENESVPIALILNELMVNAVKHLPNHAQRSEVEVTVSREGNAAIVRILNRGVLPPGFDFAAGIGIGTGLGLVKSFMPRQGAELSFRSLGDQVVALLKLSAPAIDL